MLVPVWFCASLIACFASCASEDSISNTDGGAGATEADPADASGSLEPSLDASDPNDAGDTSTHVDADASSCAKPTWNGPFDLPDGVCSIDGFCRTTHVPIYGAVRSIWAAGVNDVWATSRGGVLHWDGAKWRGLVGLPVSNNQVWPIAGSAPNDVWIRGDLHWDGAKLEKASSSVPGNETSSMWFAASNDGWAVNGTQTAYRWNGTAWIPSSTGAPLVRAIFGFASNDVWAAGDKAIRHWNGSAWTAPSNVPAIGGGKYLTTIGGAAPNDFWIGGSGMALHFVHGEWTSHPLSFGVRAIAATAADDVTFVLDPNYGSVLHWNGEDLTEDTARMTECSQCGNCNDVAVAPDGTRFFATNVPSALVTPPTNDACPVLGLSSGSTHPPSGTTRVVPGLSTMLSIVNGRLRSGAEQNTSVTWGLTADDLAIDLSAGDGDVWVVGTSGTTNLAARHDGIGWTQSVLPGKPVSAVGARTATSAWVLTEGGSAYWNGTTWTAKDWSGLLAGHANAIWGSSATDAWAAGDWIAHWDGATWSPVTNIPVTKGEYIDIRGKSANDVTAIHVEGPGWVTLFHWDGVTWSQIAGSFTGTVTDAAEAKKRFAIVAPNDIWHAPAAAGVEHWDGTCWRRLSTAGESQLSMLGASAESVVAIGGPETYHLKRGP